MSFGSRRLRGIKHAIQLTEEIGAPAHTFRYAAISERRLLYAAIFGTTSSINRRNRGLRPPATNDTCETSKAPAAEVSAFPNPFRRNRMLCVPETKNSLLIKDLKFENNARLLSFAIYINATSTPHQKNCIGTHKLALASNSQLHAIPVPCIIQSWISRR